MGSNTRETLFTSVVVLSLLVLAVYTQEGAPHPSYNAALAISAMLASVLLHTEVEKISKYFAVKEQIFVKGAVSGKTRLLDFREATVFVALVILTGLETSILNDSRFVNDSMGVMNFTFGVNILFLPVFTKILLDTVNVSRYLDSLVTTRAEPLEEGARNPIIPEGADVRAHAEESPGHLFAGVLVALVMSFFIAILPLADPALGAAFGIENYRVYLSVVILVSTLASGYCFFGTAVNRHLALCGMRRERTLLGGSPHEDAAFEVERRFALRARITATAFAILIYPTTFYVFYTMLSS